MSNIITLGEFKKLAKDKTAVVYRDLFVCEIREGALSLNNVIFLLSANKFSAMYGSTIVNALEKYNDSCAIYLAYSEYVSGIVTELDETNNGDIYELCDGEDTNNFLVLTIKCNGYAINHGVLVRQTDKKLMQEYIAKLVDSFIKDSKLHCTVLLHDAIQNDIRFDLNIYDDEGTFMYNMSNVIITKHSAMADSQTNTHNKFDGLLVYLIKALQGKKEKDTFTTTKVVSDSVVTHCCYRIQ